MFNLNQLQRPTATICLIILFIVEVVLIAFNYSQGFTDYFTVVFIVLAVPTAYFGFQYLKLKSYYDHPQLKAYNSVVLSHSSTNSQALTNLEVTRLVQSQQYKEYRRRVQRNKGEMEGTGNFKDGEEESNVFQKEKYRQMEEVCQQLVQKEDQFFDD